MLPSSIAKVHQQLLFSNQSPMKTARFSYKSATPIPATVSLADAIQVLHNFETVNKLNPDVRGARRVPPPKDAATTPPPPKDTINALSSAVQLGETQYFEVEDSLPFIPTRLWSGGVKYRADFVPVEQGCDITIHAPGGFTSINHWRLVRDDMAAVPKGHENSDGEELARVQSKDLMHIDSDGAGWMVQIISDAKCNRTFAGFVKGFLKNSHAQLQSAFVDRCLEMKKAPSARPRRPTIGRRKSSVF